MNMQVTRWCVDLAMGTAFIFSAVTGVFKVMLLMWVGFFTGMVLPVALMSDIHDRAGVVLTVLVAFHLFLNRRWIVSMTQKILAGTPDKP